ncbi:hypothetical protein [Jiangella asiatica]|nr:hypothetical protein [Jiangella asiatica]
MSTTNAPLRQRKLQSLDRLLVWLPHITYPIAFVIFAVSTR